MSEVSTSPGQSSTNRLTMFGAILKVLRDKVLANHLCDSALGTL